MDRNNRPQVQCGTPLFSHFLTIKAFSMLMMGGLLACTYQVYLSWDIGDKPGMSTNVLSLIIFILFAPYVYYVTKRILGDFHRIFYQDSSQRNIVIKKWGKVRYLFSQREAFERYRQNVFSMLYANREKYVVIGLAFCVIFPMVLIQDYQRGIVSHILSGSMPLWNIIEYSYANIYFTIMYAILLSIVWVITTIVRALLSLEKEKTHLHITQCLMGLQESIKSTNLPSATMRAHTALLTLSLRRFKAGLSSIVNFISSSSLKIAFVSSTCSIPALIYFLATKRIVMAWYALCASAVLLSVAVFVIGQYGVWRLWVSSKEDASYLLDQVCTMKTQEVSTQFSSSEEIKEVQEDLAFLSEAITDLDEMTATTYTPSVMLKLATVNFLSFGPLVLEQIFLRVLFSQ